MTQEDNFLEYTSLAKDLQCLIFLEKIPRLLFLIFLTHSIIDRPHEKLVFSNHNSVILLLHNEEQMFYIWVK